MFGSGKSTIAAALAPFIGAVPGAVVLRSDEGIVYFQAVKDDIEPGHPAT